MPDPEVLWAPTPESLAEARLTAFAREVGERAGRDLSDYDDLWQWSVDDVAGFWGAVWSHFGLDAISGYDAVLGEDAMPGTQWFPGARLNFAEYLLGRGEADDVAIVATDEAGRMRMLTWGALREEVTAVAAGLRRLGVGEGDRVVGYLPNVPEAVVAFLATATLGAVWSGVGQDYAPSAAVDRFAQLEPTVLLAANGYHFNGRVHDRCADVAELDSQLPTVRHVVLVDSVGTGRVPGALLWADLHADASDVAPVQVSFEHPLWVLFSSGTTGIPKGLVHGHGGILLESLKNHALQFDVRPGDRVFWYTSPSWVMWNIQLSALAVGASIVCYDGAPAYPDARALWSLVADTGTTFFGMSPGFLQAGMNLGVRPAHEFDLGALRTMGSTGSPLGVDVHRWAAREVPGVPLCSASGGTDVATGLCGGAPNVPVWAGEISCRALGVAMYAWDEDGHAVSDAVGELVVTEPMPSMPVSLWNDPDGERYRGAYFDRFPGVWRHGDWITVTGRGSVVIHGRSDSTLNRHGVRMGSADIYSAVDRIDAVAESLVIGAEQADGSYWMPLFVVLADGTTLDDALVERINDEIRTHASPRHVPDEVIAVRAIPHTRTGKKLEVPVKRILQGAAVAAVANPDSVDDPTLLDSFAALWAARAR